jgi:hypothetical protein
MTLLSYGRQVKILSHLKKKDRLPSSPDALPETGAPPQINLFG